MNKKYVIIGYGVAGANAAEEIRTKDHKGSITIINNEPFPAYYRAALSFYIKGSITEDELYQKPDTWAKEKNIKIVTDEVASLRPTEKEILTEAGLTLCYDKLLIATGAEPFVPPWPGADTQGVMTYRTLVCVNRQRDYIKKHDVKQAVVVGGGVLGVELADNYRFLGLDVTLIELADRIVALLFDEKASTIIKTDMEKDGIKILTGTEVSEIIGDERVTAVALKNETRIPADLVGVAIGVRPVAKFIEKSGILADRGIIVDPTLKTSHDDVYAAGDVAVIRDGARITICRTWLTAAEMGKRAGASMAGESAEFSEVFYNASHVYKSLYAIVGKFNAPEENGVRHVLVDAPDGNYAKLIVDGDHIIGGQFIGNIRPAWQVYHALMRGAPVRADKVSFSGGLLADGLPQLAYGVF